MATFKTAGTAAVTDALARPIHHEGLRTMIMVPRVAPSSTANTKATGSQSIGYNTFGLLGTM